MSYSQALAASARRHLNAALRLDDTDRRDVAGYLFGVSAECALKEIMRGSGMRPLPPEKRRDDPFYAHFPVLKTMLRDTASGRRSGELRRYAADEQFMQHWDTDMRYAPSGDVLLVWVDRWREQAKKIVDTMFTQ